ncbi:MAG: hypothetical protein WDN28_01280 [Chthoniobacter sp.]
MPLYLVNRTNEDRSFDSQDSDLYIKLEFKDAAGAWRRPRLIFRVFAAIVIPL